MGFFSGLLGNAGAVGQEDLNNEIFAQAENFKKNRA